MALKTLKQCQECIHDCKVMVDAKMYDKTELMSCPNNKSFTKK